MDFVTLVRSRLATVGCAQKDLAQAAQQLRDLDARWKQAKEAPKEKA